MKLMTYNIWNGAVKTLPHIIEIVKNESPDYLTINEANTFADYDNEILQKFALATNFPYFEIALSGQFNYHVAVFSKYPFQKVDKLQPLARACIITSITTNLGPLSIASLHLNPFSEDMRHPEIELITNFQQDHSCRIIMGDMNSLSSQDGYNDEITKNFSKEQLQKFALENKLRFDAIDKILEMGYFDSAVEMKKNKDYTVPTPANVDPQHAQVRLDYIFVSQPLLPYLKSYSVIKTDLTNTASDHYPVTVELTI